MLLGTKNTLGALKNYEKREVIMFIARQCTFESASSDYSAHWDYKGGDLTSEIKYIFMFSNEVTRLYKGK